MIRKRMFGGAALLLALASTMGAQEPADPMAAMQARMDSMQQMMEHMHQMMMSMHGGMGADGHDVAQPTQGAMGGQGPGMMMGRQGMGMEGSGPGGGGVCLARGPDGALSALLLAPAGALQLTEAQRAEIQAILAKAQADAQEKLTPEQRAKLDMVGPWAGGACAGPMGMGARPN
jgi:hypothetical protein